MSEEEREDLKEGASRERSERAEREGKRGSERAEREGKRWSSAREDCCKEGKFRVLDPMKS